MSCNELQQKATEQTERAKIQETKERRAFRRRPFRGKVYFQTNHLGMTPAIEATPINISEDGISFKTRKAPAARSIILIEMHHATLAKPFKAHAEVLWVSGGEAGFHRVGCRWGQRMNSSVLHRFL
jgi:hypothetical protein